MLKTLHADMKLIAIIGEIYIHYIWQMGVIVSNQPSIALYIVRIT
jgi:hypothetical protein